MGNNELTLGKIYELLAKCVQKNESNLSSAMAKLEAEDDVGQAELFLSCSRGGTFLQLRQAYYER